jgi:probable biosynthetic protein (TIGR04098 family)
MTASIRRETLKPAMCGPSSQFLGQVGDWTWDAVSDKCGTDVLAARDVSGMPAYLAFYYYRVRASAAFHVGALTFGDRIDVRSSVFGFGSESVLTLHEIRRSNGVLPDSTDIECDEFFERPRDGRIYIENLNRWISRRKADSNEDLVAASPTTFRSEQLPLLPDQYSPRSAYTYARAHLSFVEQAAATTVRQLSFDYDIDVTRDVNGVGLIYFASYFAMVDSAIYRLWRKLGRSPASFLARVVVDRQICYVGNVAIDGVLVIDVTLRNALSSGDEVFDVVLREREGARLVAVSSVRILKRELMT